MKLVVAALVVLSPLSTCGTQSKDGPASPEPQPSAVTEPVPDLRPVPLESFSEAGIDEGSKSTYEQAKAYVDDGRVWPARLILEKKALGDTGTRDEVLLLQRICEDQNDQDCVDACITKSGGKIKARRDAGAKPSAMSAAQDLLKKGKTAQAKKLLEPDVVSGAAPREQIELLRVVCGKLKDKACIAMSDAKLKSQ